MIKILNYNTSEYTLHIRVPHFLFFLFLYDEVNMCAIGNCSIKIYLKLMNFENKHNHSSLNESLCKGLTIEVGELDR